MLYIKIIFRDFYCNLRAFHKNLHNMPWTYLINSRLVCYGFATNCYLAHGLLLPLSESESKLLLLQMSCVEVSQILSLLEQKCKLVVCPFQEHHKHPIGRWWGTPLFESVSLIRNPVCLCCTYALLASACKSVAFCVCVPWFL